MKIAFCSPDNDSDWHVDADDEKSESNSEVEEIVEERSQMKTYSRESG